MIKYCFRADCECDLDVDEAYEQGYNEAIEDFLKELFIVKDFSNWEVICKIAEKLKEVK